MNYVPHAIATAIAFINLAGALGIAAYCARGGFSLFWYKDLRRTHGLIATGVLWALSLMLAATLIKTLALRTWSDIGMFCVVLVLRLGLKSVFRREQPQLRAQGS